MSPKLFTQRTIDRHPQYISTSNTLITITVTPIGGTPTTYGPTACTSASCTITFATTPGPTILAFSLTDGSSNVLSNFSTTVIIQPATINTLRFTANPVVNSVALQLASPSINAGTATNDLLTLQAKDIDGNIIIGNANYVDLNGNPVAFTLGVSNSQAGGMGTVNILGPTYITAPGQAATYVHYDGNWLASSTISVSSSSSAITTLTGTTLTTTPTIAADYIVPGGVYPQGGIIVGPDGNFWFSEGGHYIERMTSTGTFTQFNIASNAWAMALTNGSDGNLWFTEGPAGGSYPGGGVGNNAIGRITTGGVITEFPIPNGSGLNAGFRTNYETFGPDGNLWFAEHSANVIGNISKDGFLTQFPIPSNGSAIAVGSDKNLWLGEAYGSRIFRITTSGIVSQFTIPGGRGEISSMVAGPDGNIWFSEQIGGNIGRITPSGAISEFSPPTGSALVLGMIVGPDGNIWFADHDNNLLGQVTMSGGITEYTTPLHPGGLTIGPDKNIWITHGINNSISKFVY